MNFVQHSNVQPLPIESVSASVKLTPADRKAIDAVVEKVALLLISEEEQLPEHLHKLVDAALDAYNTNPTTEGLAAVRNAKANEEAAKASASDITAITHAAIAREVETLSPIADKYLADVIEAFEKAAREVVATISGALRVFGGGEEMLPAYQARIARTVEALEHDRGTIATGAALAILCRFDLAANPLCPVQGMELREKIASRRKTAAPATTAV
jgi:hypothetical protein